MEQKQRTATIIITPDSESKLDLQKGAVSTYEIINIISGLQQILSKMLVQEYVELTGDKEVDGEKFEEWITFLRNNKL